MNGVAGLDGGGGGAGIGAGAGSRAMVVESEFIQRHHRHQPRENQCSSALVKHIRAPLQLVWSLVRRFDQPQKYKPFISRCVVRGDLAIGSVREVNVKSGLPATTSTERLELLDDNQHILSIKIVGGDHRLRNLPYEAMVELLTRIQTAVVEDRFCGNYTMVFAPKQWMLMLPATLSFYLNLTFLTSNVVIQFPPSPVIFNTPYVVCLPLLTFFTRL